MLEQRSGAAQKRVIWHEKAELIFNSFYALYHSSIANTALIEKLNTNPQAYVTGANIDIVVDNTLASATGDAASSPKKLFLHNVKTDSPPSLKYRVINISGNCYFKSGSAYIYGIDCTNQGAAEALNAEMNAIFNTHGILEMNIAMLDGRVCKVLSYNANDNGNWTLSPNSQCPSSIPSTLPSPSDSPTIYFMPPRIIVFGSDISSLNLKYARSVLENLGSPR